MDYSYYCCTVLLYDNPNWMACSRLPNSQNAGNISRHHLTIGGGRTGLTMGLTGSVRLLANKERFLTKNRQNYTSTYDSRGERIFQRSVLELFEGLFGYAPFPRPKQSSLYTIIDNNSEYSSFYDLGKITSLGLPSRPKPRALQTHVGDGCEIRFFIVL